LTTTARKREDLWHVINYFPLGRNMRKLVASIRSLKRLFQRNSLNRIARWVKNNYKDRSLL
jgi:hypothetical protein